MIKNDKTTRLYLIDQLRPNHCEVNEYLIEDLIDLVNEFVIDYEKQIKEKDLECYDLELKLESLTKEYRLLNSKFSSSLSDL